MSRWIVVMVLALYCLRRSIGLSVLAMGAIGGWVVPAIAQSLIVPDTTLGAESSIVQPRVDGTLQYDVITGGATRGTGLFHSFSQFSVGDRLNAQFSVSPTIQNIFARVTGGDVSRIDGLLGTGIDNGTTLGASPASLFLLNPNGVIFGPNAKLDLAGSFLATTASGFKFAGGAEFSAVNPQTAPLLTVSVPTGLQFGQQVGGIEVNGARLQTSSVGHSLSLIGGQVKITDSQLFGFAGQLDVGAVGAGETIALSPVQSSWQADYTGVQNFLDIQVNQSTLFIGAIDIPSVLPVSLQLQGRNMAINNSTVSSFYTEIKQPTSQVGTLKLIANGTISLDDAKVSTGTDGSINNSDIFIKARSFIANNGTYLLGGGNGALGGGNIKIEASDKVEIKALSDKPSYVFTVNQGAGDQSSGNVVIETAQLNILDGSRINTLLIGKGKAGDIEVNASGDVTIARGNRFLGGISSTTLDDSQGKTGDITIRAKNLSLLDGGLVRLSSFNDFDTGLINLQIKDKILISGSTKEGIGSYIGNSRDSVNLSTQDTSLNREQAVGIKIQSTSLTLQDGGIIETISSVNSDSKSIIIDTSDSLIIKGATRNRVNRPTFNGFLDSKISSTKLNGIGSGGDITIRTRSVQVLDGAGIESDINAYSNETPGIQIPRTPGDVFQGKSGDILIEASDSVLVQGNSIEPIFVNPNLYSSSRISSSVGATGNAQGGKVSIKTKDLRVLDGGQIRSDILNRGQAGSVEIVARGNIVLSGKGKTELRGYSSSISSAASIQSSGNAGKVQVQASSLNILDGAGIFASTRGTGNAGSAVVDVQGDILISGISSVGDTSGISSSANSLRGQERADYIGRTKDLRFGSLLPEDEVGNGGNVQITGNSLRLTNGGIIGARSDGKGVAGNININLRGNLIADGGEIKTTSEQTAGGNVDLTARAIVLRNNSNIKTNIGSGSGSGGNIQLKADGIVLLDDSDILAFAKDGQGGNISLRTPALLTRTYRPSDPAADLLTLDTNGFVDINATGATSGIITLPDLNPLQNNRPELAQGLLDADQALSRSCLARNPKTGKFYITGAGGVPLQPGDPSLSSYSTLPVASSTTEFTQIVEADGFYPMENGKMTIGKSCQTAQSR
jgi:filamentous hemagglutinin family protein